MPATYCTRPVPGVPAGILAACLAGCQSAAPPAPAERPEVFAPLAHGNGELAMEVYLPGGLKTWFLFDSGSGDLSLVDTSLSRQLHLQPRVVENPQMPYLSLQTQLPAIEAGAVGRRGMDVYVDDFSSLEHLRDLEVTGVVGTGMFRGHCLRFDLANGVYSTNHRRAVKPGYVVLPLRWGPQGTLYASVAVNDVAIDALVDTGARRTLVAPSFALRTGLPIADAPGETPLEEGQRREARIRVLALGHEKLGDVPVQVAESEDETPGAVLRLGMDILSRYGLIFDLAEVPYLVLDPATGLLAARAAEETETPPSGEPPGQ